jgi:hypothetical protein
MALTKLNFGGSQTALTVSDIPTTGLIGGLTYNGGTTLGNLRIQTGTATTPSTSTDAGTAEGLSARYYNDTTVTLTGFASAPTVFVLAQTSYHETVSSPVTSVSSSSVTFRTRSARTGGLHGITLQYLAIGQAS